MLIGTLATAGSISFSLGAFTFGRLSDVIGKRRSIIIITLLLGTLVNIGYLFGHKYIHFLFLVIMDMVAIGAYSVLVDTVVSSALPQQNRGGGFGAYRISGSIGYALAASIIGPITNAFGIQSIFLIGAISLFLAAISASALQDDPLLENGQADLERPSWRGAFQALMITGIIWLVIADLITVAGEQAAFPFLNIYLQDQLNASAGIIGILSTLRVLMEIPAMIGLGRLSDRVGRPPILVIGFLTITLSWLLIFLAPDLTLVFVGFPLAGMGIIRYTVGVSMISDRVPSRQRGTLIGMINLSFGIGGIFAPTIGGLMAERIGTRYIFLFAFIIDFIAFLIFALAIRMKKISNDLPITPISAPPSKRL